MAHATGVSLWLTPDGELALRLGALIRDLARRLQSPVFAPHVTLLGGLEVPEDVVVAKTSELARALRPFPIRLTAIGGTDDYFRCVYVRAENTQPLQAAHLGARELFGLAEAEFRPHLSLVYGALPPETRHRLEEQITPELPWSFEARRLEAVQTRGPVSEWRSLLSQALG